MTDRRSSTAMTSPSHASSRRTSHAGSRRASHAGGSRRASHAGGSRRSSHAGSRRKSVVQALVDTFNNNYDEEEETERLEAIIAEEERPEPKSKLSRFRRKGTQIVHSKQVLMVIVLLNVIDCLLVTGELILDIHYIKGILDESDILSQTFIDKMEDRYPDNLNGHQIDNLGLFYDSIYSAKCYWGTDHGANCGTKTKRQLLVEDDDDDGKSTSFTKEQETSEEKAKEAHAHSVWEDVAHGLHKASIAILGVLCLEVILKIFFMGKKFFKQKIEVFDSIIIIASFTLDLVFLKGLTIYRIQDGILVLSFLLPWRVIRVVNSLIVAVLDHEHFRLKMIYKQKKTIAADLDMEENKTQRLKEMLKKIEGFLEKEGMPRWKFVHYTHFEERNISVASMASLTLKSVMDNFFGGQCRKPRQQDDDDDFDYADYPLNNNISNVQSRNSSLISEHQNGHINGIIENGISHHRKGSLSNGSVHSANGHVGTGTGHNGHHGNLHVSWSCATLPKLDEESNDVKVDIRGEKSGGNAHDHVVPVLDERIVDPAGERRTDSVVRGNTGLENTKGGAVMPTDAGDNTTIDIDSPPTIEADVGIIFTASGDDMGAVNDARQTRVGIDNPAYQVDERSNRTSDSGDDEVNTVNDNERLNVIAKCSDREADKVDDNKPSNIGIEVDAGQAHRVNDNKRSNMIIECGNGDVDKVDDNKRSNRIIQKGGEVDKADDNTGNTSSQASGYAKTGDIPRDSLTPPEAHNGESGDKHSTGGGGLNDSVDSVIEIQIYNTRL